jgi:wobble nucleotide-excising tRNase
VKLRISLKNCYGISELTHEFDFTNTGGYAIYAPNGFMKTSLAKTFIARAKGEKPKDLIFPDRESESEIKDGTGAELASDSILVIEPFVQDYSSEKTSLLLVNSAIKKQYDDALKKIADKQSTLFSKLKQLSGLTGRTVTPETEILKCFDGQRIADLFESLEPTVNTSQADQLSTIVYDKIFNDKAIGLLESGTIKDQLEEYIQTYNNLVSKSDVLSKQFNHYSANTVNKQLKDNGFFDAKHSVNLNTKNGKQEVATSEELASKIEDERKKILTDKDLVSKFDAIDKKIQNTELRDFRNYLFENQHLLPHIKNYKDLQKKLWILYLASEKQLYTDFLIEFRKGKATIEAAIKQAKAEKTEWEEVVNIFNRRFNIPFEMNVANQDDVILKGSQPTISFKFNDADGEKVVEKKNLFEVLSQGEHRALYILNILFEIRSREKLQKSTVLVIDDIADSFDYKNKYAIIEYLKDLSNSGKFYCLFLSHNFDFYRTISGRLNLKREHKLHASKSGRKISLFQEKYQKNPFNHWKDHLQQNSGFCVASIPFVRNLAEYCGHDTEFGKLTSLLHMKADTNTITINDLCTIYKTVLVDKPNLTLEPKTKLVVNLIHEESELLFNAVDEDIELEGKIILSIAIRLHAEAHMIKRINNQTLVNNISENQTIELLKEYKKSNRGTQKEVELLEQVNLMTPENIHLNSFMYEPILDMGIAHLKNLYSEVKALQK